MLGEPERASERDAWMVERAVVLQILRDDREEEHWSRMELARELAGCESAILDRALARLEREGVLHVDGARVWASRAARRLEELALICI